MRRILLLLVTGSALALSGCAFLFNTPPTAVISSSAFQGECPLTVTFSGGSSSDPDGDITDYAWDFGDGWTGRGMNALHTFTAPGTYSVCLTVSDAEGETDQAFVTIHALASETFERRFAWTSHGMAWEWEVAIPKALYWYYRSQEPRSWCSDTGFCDWYKYVTDRSDDAFIESLSTNLMSAISGYFFDSVSAYYGFLQFTLDFVGEVIPYTLDSVPDEWPRYPLETLMEVEGDCEDTAILFASLVRPYAQSVHLVFFPSHAAAAVPVDWDFVASRSYTVGYYEYNGQYFVMVETTGDPPSYWKIGELPEGLADAWVTGDFWFYDVGQRSSLAGKGLVHSPE